MFKVNTSNDRHIDIITAAITRTLEVRSCCWRLHAVIVSKAHALKVYYNMQCMLLLLERLHIRTPSDEPLAQC